MCISLGLAGVASYLIFPEIIFHIFKGYRGKASFNNLVSANIIRGFKIYTDILLSEITGFLIIPVIAFVIAVLVYSAIKKEKKECKMLPGILPFVFSGVCFIAVVSKISPQFADRYIWCVCPIIFVCVFSCFFIALRMIMPEKTALLIFTAVVLCSGVITLKGGLNYDFNEFVPAVRKIEQYSDTECICIYEPELFYMTVCNYPELKNFDRVRYYSSENIDLNEVVIGENEKELIMIMSTVQNKDEIIGNIKTAGKYTKEEILCSDGEEMAVDSFLLSR